MFRRNETTDYSSPEETENVSNVETTRATSHARANRDGQTLR